MITLTTEDLRDALVEHEWPLLPERLTASERQWAERDTDFALKKVLEDYRSAQRVDLLIPTVAYLIVRGTPLADAIETVLELPPPTNPTTKDWLDRIKEHAA